MITFYIQLFLHCGIISFFTYLLTKKEKARHSFYYFDNKSRSAIFGLTCAIIVGLVTFITSYFGYRTGIISYLRNIKHINFQYIFDGFLFFVLLALLFIEKESLESIGIIRHKLIKALIDGIFISIVYIFIGIILKVLFSSHIYNIAQLASVIKNISKHSFIGYKLIPTFIMVGFTEEFVYRGYIQTRLTNWIGNIQGIIISSLFFSFNHLSVLIITSNMSFQQAFIGCIQLLPISITLGYIFFRTRNIVVPSIIHTIINIFNIYI